MIRRDRGLFVLCQVKWPKLPTGYARSMPHMEKREKKVLRDDPFLGRLNVERQHDKRRLIPKKPILQVPPKRHHRHIVILRSRGSLPEIKREKSGPLGIATF